MSININIGLMGHVDSGKTSLARALAPAASTAAFDKNPQSQERGITLDLGFSYVERSASEKLKKEWKLLQESHCNVNENIDLDTIQLGFVDCPGHASFIRTVIGGAQIIDMMLLVIDVKMGIQSQTAECIVIGEILKKQLIVVINKIDELPADKSEFELSKFEARLRKTLAKTNFGSLVPIFHVSALKLVGVSELLDGIVDNLRLPERKQLNHEFVMYIDHCFPIKGQGTICTGTVVAGQIKVGDNIEFPSIREQRKIKSIQKFMEPIEMAKMGDRIGICITQFNAKKLERGIACKLHYLQPILAAVIDVNRIIHYKFPIKSNSKLHLTIGHSTVMAKITIFSKEYFNEKECFNTLNEYEYIEELVPLSELPMINNIENQQNDHNFHSMLNKNKKCAIYALLEFDKSIIVPPNAILIASKLDLNAYTPNCRLAFWGNLQWHTTNTNYQQDDLINWKIYQVKEKRGVVQRLINSNEVIVQNLFQKKSNREIYIGYTVTLETGEKGIIESSFGKTEKVKIRFHDKLSDFTLANMTKGKFHENKVILQYKRYIFSKKTCKIE